MFGFCPLNCSWRSNAAESWEINRLSLSALPVARLCVLEAVVLRPVVFLFSLWCSSRAPSSKLTNWYSARLWSERLYFVPRGHRSKHILKLVHLPLKLHWSLLALYFPLSCHPKSLEVTTPPPLLPPSPSSSECRCSRGSSRDHFGFGPFFLLTATLFSYRPSVLYLHRLARIIQEILMFVVVCCMKNKLVQK